MMQLIRLAPFLAAAAAWTAAPSFAQCVTSAQARQMMGPRPAAFYQRTHDEQQVLLAHEQALFWFLDAKCAARSAKEMSILARVGLVLTNALFRLEPVQSEASGCGDGILAFVDPAVSLRRIHICPLSISLGVQALAQTIVHEAFHSFGVFSECDAYRAEMAVMTLAGAPSHYESGYKESCGG
jgi:hypothetical protein